MAEHVMMRLMQRSAGLADTSPARQQAEPILRLSGICKRFQGVQALQDVALTLSPGEVLALVGENGAGKSTLVKILTGVYRPDAGEIRLDDRPIAFADPLDAMRAGITAVHQETVMFDELSVAENIYMGHHPKTAGPVRRIDWAAMEHDARQLFQRLDVPLPVRAKVKTLGVAHRHYVQIARALSHEARIVILDEPTAALSQAEIHELYRVIEQLKAAGTAVIFISHKFGEVFAVADRFVVLRDGRFVADGRLANVTEQALIAMMVGRSIAQVFPKREVELGETVLEVDDISHPTEFDGISFKLRRGEILGFYGLVGAGRSELMQALFGLTPVARGTVRLAGAPVSIASPEQAIELGIAYLPEDRQAHGALLAMSIQHNVTLPLLRRIGRWLLGRRRTELAVTRRYAKRLQLRADHFAQAVAQLSGGNQQKVVLAKWLATNPKVIILDEPTKGVDIGSKAAVHEFTSELAAQGLAVILVSSELPEVLGMSDRIMVMYRGRIRTEFARHAATSEAVVAAASGT